MTNKDESLSSVSDSFTLAIPSHASTVCRDGVSINPSGFFNSQKAHDSNDVFHFSQSFLGRGPVSHLIDDRLGGQCLESGSHCIGDCGPNMNAIDGDFCAWSEYQSETPCDAI